MESTRGITRKDFLKGAVGAVAATAMGTALASCSLQTQGSDGETTQASGTYKPGIYEGVADGFAGIMRVHIEVDAEKITNAYIAQNTETKIKIPSETAAEIICSQIVEKQSLAIDTVAGATFTSLAILSAAEQALDQAGADVDALKQPVQSEAVQKPDESVDILVIGGGAAGLSAALAAATIDYSRQKSGHTVMLIERNAFVGGSSMLSDGGCGVCSGALANDRLKTSMTGDQLTDFCESLCKETLNRAYINKMASVDGNVITSLIDLATPFATSKATIKVEVSPGVGYVEMRVDQYTNPEADGAFGVRITSNLAENCEEMGVLFKTQCVAESLIVEGDAVQGVKVSEPDGVYSIRAKKIILATGGFAHNDDMVAKYAPDYVGSVAYCGGGSKGSGIQMALDQVGASVVGDGLIAYPGYGWRYGMGGTKSGYLRTGVYVNKNGERFEDDRGVDLRAIGRNICKQPDKMVYDVFDSSAPYAPLVPKAMEQGFAYTSDTLEDLAEQIGVPADALIASVENARKAINAGEDLDFGVPVDYLNPVQGPPYYAVVVQSIAIGSLPGLKVTENCEVVGADGAAVPNLYAVGEAMLGNFMSSYYLLGSYSIGNCMPSGYIAAEHAKLQM
jgi:fumarate reductase flavoprotein subunit